MIHYFILTHKNPEQLSLLIDKLESENSKIYVHVDLHTNIDSFLYLKDKIIFIKKRVGIKWGGFSMVQATLNSFSEILPYMNEGDHVIVMSGQDLPIKSQEHINNFFKKNKDKSFIENKVQPNENRNILNRVIKYHFHDLTIPNWINNFFYKLASNFYNVSGLRNQIFCYITQRIVNFFLPIKRYLIKNYKIYWGSQWQALSKEHLKYLIDFCLTKKGKKVIKSFKTTAGPDEIFFQTVLLNSEHKNNIENNLLRYIDWKKGPGLPRILDMSDLQELKKSDKLFARKFDIDIDKEVFYHIV